MKSGSQDRRCIPSGAGRSPTSQHLHPYCALVWHVACDGFHMSESNRCCSYRNVAGLLICFRGWTEDIRSPWAAATVEVQHVDPELSKLQLLFSVWENLYLEIYSCSQQCAATVTEPWSGGTRQIFQSVQVKYCCNLSGNVPASPMNVHPFILSNEEQERCFWSLPQATVVFCAV